ncbi:38313_t:CDS:10 [Gigaspora margarita]|uniref:38313_t:CDS:1 n=1 Tax=Gigaspora margarita TaxID=4874 RepID=A0ABN7USE2_GIGMA|nr:38313_t:CDS:10 [Gigaspora margarita]
MEELPQIPPLLRKTAESRSVYPINLTVNSRKFIEIHIDPHCFEGERKKYVSPELIYYFALKLDNQQFIPEDYEKGDKEIIEKISNPNYEVGNYILPKNASMEDRFKHEICQTILKYQQESQISYQEISRQIGLPFAKSMNILKGRINNFTLTELVNYLEKLTIPSDLPSKDKLKSLNLFGNEIQEVDFAELFTKFPKLEKINLGGNPLKAKNLDNLSAEQFGKLELISQGNQQQQNAQYLQTLIQGGSAAKTDDGKRSGNNTPLLIGGLVVFGLVAVAVGYLLGVNMKKENNNFDQFYTNPLTAKKLTSIFTEKLKELDYQKINFLEPSAGTGNFLEAIREINKNNSFIGKKILAFDIEPKSEKENIIKTNFLKVPLTKYLKKEKRNNYVVIGNPPFGKKGKLALNFINKSAEVIDTIGFILPLTFRRWSIHKNELAKQKLLQLDFAKLAQKNTITPDDWLGIRQGKHLEDRDVLQKGNNELIKNNFPTLTHNTYFRSPYGSQNFPDFLVFTSQFIIPIELKASKRAGNVIEEKLTVKGAESLIRVAFEQAKSLLLTNGGLDYFQHPKRKEIEDKDVIPGLRVVKNVKKVENDEKIEDKKRGSEWCWKMPITYLVAYRAALNIQRKW